MGSDKHLSRNAWWGEFGALNIGTLNKVDNSKWENRDSWRFLCNS